MTVYLVLGDGGSRVRAYSSEPAAEGIAAGYRVLVTATGTKPGASNADVCLLRALGSEPGPALPSHVGTTYSVSLLRTTMQKLVRRQMAPQAGRVAVQYLRQLAVTGTKAVNEERKTMLQRLTVVAAEDADAVPSLAIAHFHWLGATSKALQWGENDAAAVAACWASVAGTATYPRGECAARQERNEPETDPGDPSLGELTPEIDALLYCARAVRDAIESRSKGSPEGKWLRQLREKLRAAPGPEAVQAAEIVVPEVAGAEAAEAAEQPVACAFSADDARSLLRNVALEPLPEEAMPFYAVDHHAKSKDQEKRFEALAKKLLECVAAGGFNVVKAAKKTTDVTKSKLGKELKFEALHNVRGKPLRDSVPVAGTWQAIVAEKWPECARQIWRDSTTTNSPSLFKGASAGKKRPALGGSGGGGGGGSGSGSGGGGGGGTSGAANKKHKLEGTMMSFFAKE
jgi:hypothetical protein